MHPLPQKEMLMLLIRDEEVFVCRPPRVTLHLPNPILTSRFAERRE